MQPIVPRARRQYVLPHHPKQKRKQSPSYHHNYNTWQCYLLLLHVAIFFTTPNAPPMTTIPHYYNTLPHDTSVTSPCNTHP